MAEKIPEHDREVVGFVIEAHFLGACRERFLGFARGSDPGEVALDIGGEDRNPGAR